MGEMGRVAVGVTSHRSHRSVRAQLRHTVRQRTGWQCGSDTSAEACRPPRTLSSRVTVTGDEAAEGSAGFPPLSPPGNKGDIAYTVALFPRLSRPHPPSVP